MTARETMSGTRPYGRFVKSKNGIYLECDEAVGAFSGQTPDDMIGRHDGDLSWNDIVKIADEGWWNLASGKWERAYGIGEVFNPITRTWGRLHFEGEMVRGDIHGISVETTDVGMFRIAKRLDFYTETLKVADGIYLNRKDLIALHGYLLRDPMKVIAQELHVQPKAIEKRLQRVRDDLARWSGVDLSARQMTRMLRDSGLTAFITHRQDWFNTASSMIIRDEPGADNESLAFVSPM